MRMMVLGVAVLWSGLAVPDVEVVVHRGMNEYAPENTLAAAKLAVEHGVDYVEIDVRTSKDDVMYIIHDARVDRTTDGEGPVYRMTSEELDALDAGSWFSEEFEGEPIPRLRLFLEWAKGKVKVYFDVKSADIDKVVAMVREFDMEDDVFFWFGLDSRALEFSRAYPDIPLKINASTPEGVREANEKFGADIIECGVDDLSPAFVELCHELGMKVMVRHGEKDPEAFRRIIEGGADMVNLDHPDVFVSVQAELRAAAHGG